MTPEEKLRFVQPGMYVKIRTDIDITNRRHGADERMRRMANNKTLYIVERLHKNVYKSKTTMVQIEGYVWAVEDMIPMSFDGSTKPKRVSDTFDEKELVV